MLTITGTIFQHSSFGINESFGSWEKNLSINFSKANTKFCLSLHYNADNSNLFVNVKQIFKFEANNKNVNFPTQFCLESVSNGFIDVSRKVSLNGKVYDFPMWILIKQVFIVLLSFSESLATKCVSLNDKLCMIGPVLIDLNLV